MFGNEKWESPRQRKEFRRAKTLNDFGIENLSQQVTPVKAPQVQRAVPQDSQEVRRLKMELECWKVEKENTHRKTSDVIMSKSRENYRLKNDLRVMIDRAQEYKDQLDDLEIQTANAHQVDLEIQEELERMHSEERNQRIALEKEVMMLVNQKQVLAKEVSKLSNQASGLLGLYNETVKALKKETLIRTVCQKQCAQLQNKCDQLEEEKEQLEAYFSFKMEYK